MSILSYSTILFYITLGSSIYPITTYFSAFKNHKREIHFIGILVLVSGITNVLGTILTEFGFYNIILLNSEAILEFILFNVFYYYTYFKNAHNRVLIMGAINLLAMFIIFTFFSGNLFKENLNFMWLTSLVVISGYSLIYLKRFISMKQEDRYNMKDLYWINLGILLFGVFALLPFAFTDTMLNHLPDGFVDIIWNFVLFGNIIRNILLGYGIYLHAKTPIVD
jgi:hypothetical protein